MHTVLTTGTENFMSSIKTLLAALLLGFIAFGSATTSAENANNLQVEVFEGIAYAAIDDAVRAFDVFTGEEIERLSLGGGNIVSLAREGTSLFTIDNANRLRAVDLVDRFTKGHGRSRGWPKG